jgi:hypothetical protein
MRFYKRIPWLRRLHVRVYETANEYREFGRWRFMVSECSPATWLWRTHTHFGKYGVCVAWWLPESKRQSWGSSR